jgi:putative inorganic carbon (HCO3(-)) transporter
LRGFVGSAVRRLGVPWFRLVPGGTGLRTVGPFEPTNREPRTDELTHRRTIPSRAAPLLVVLVPLGALAALGGAYSSSTVPLLMASAAAFFASGARVAATPDTRAMDTALIAVLAAMLAQLLPLPALLVATLSPHAGSFHDMLALAPATPMRPLSIDPIATRDALATAASCILLFWAARETFARGGVRTVARAVASGGFAVSLVSLVQRATAPDLLLWTWKPLDPGAQPYGPFVNRNHFATWLLMAGGLTAGYLVTHLRAHGFERHRSTRLLARDLLANGSALLLVGCTAAMLLALVASLSRAALLGLAAGAVVAVRAARQARRRDVSIALGAAVLLVAFAAAVWVNREALLARFATDAGAPGRLAIWRETMPILGDFWLTGTGAGTYGTAMLRYQVTRPGTLFNQAHNEYLQLAAEGGIVLSGAAVVVAWAWIRAARRQLARAQHGLRWIRIGAAAGICGIAVQGLFEAGLRMPANGLLLAVLAAIVAGREHS